MRTFFFVFCFSLGGLPLWAADPEVLHVGIADSILQETPASLREVSAFEFSKLVKDFTGLKAVSLQGLDPGTAARQLEAGKWHLGVFEGVEFAWLQASHPRLRPFMVVVTQPGGIRALLVVKKNAERDGFRDLQGQEVCYVRTKLPCRLFADKETGGQANRFFGKLWQRRAAEDALNDVLAGKVKGAIVDSESLEYYQYNNPGKFKHLQIAARSDLFPSRVIVYRQGVLSDRLLGKLRRDILQINRTPKGKAALDLFRISSFQPVSPDYLKTLAHIARVYPAPLE